MKPLFREGDFDSRISTWVDASDEHALFEAWIAARDG
jgi:hypothetical protein